MSEGKAHEFTPIRVGGATKAKIKLGAAVLGKTMTEFTEDAVLDFMSRGKDMLEANQAAILAGEPIPFTIEAYAEELVKRRSI